MKAGVDYIGVGVGVVLLDTLGRVFLAKRGPKASNEAGTWEFPGGRVERGERLAQAIKREMKEEYGITIEVDDQPFYVCDHIIPDEGQHWLSPTFLGRIIEGEPTILEPDKCSAINWFWPSELESLGLRLSLVTQDDLAALRRVHPELFCS